MTLNAENDAHGFTEELYTLSHLRHPDTQDFSVPKKYHQNRDVMCHFMRINRIIVDFHGTFGRLHSATRGMHLLGNQTKLLFWKEICCSWAATWNGWIIWTSIHSQHLSLHTFTPFPLRSDCEGTILLGTVEIAYWPHPSDSLLVQRPKGHVVKRAHAFLVSLTFETNSMPLLWLLQRSYLYCFKMMALEALALMRA